MQLKEKFFQRIVLVLVIFLFYGCGTITYTVGGWKVGQVINPQFAEKAIVVDKYQFNVPLRSWFGYTSLADSGKRITGEASGCLIASLQGSLPGYAVVRAESDKEKALNPTASIIRISFKDVRFKRNFTDTGYICYITVNLQTKSESKEVEVSGGGSSFQQAIEDACDKMSEQIQKIIENIQH